MGSCPLIAGQPAYRAGRWVRGKFQYPGTPHKLTAAPPREPAAVLIHDAAGRVTTLCLDLDTSKATQAVVDADAQRLGALLASCGLRYVEDFSPSGGRHVYVPLAEPMDGAEARELVAALARTAPSMDASPHQNLSTGCIRVPGALHKRGGHQQLITPLSSAYDILRRRNPAGDVDKLRQALAPELRRSRQEAALRAKAAPSPLTPQKARDARSCTPAAGWQSPLAHPRQRRAGPASPRWPWTTPRTPPRNCPRRPSCAATRYGRSARWVRLPGALHWCSWRRPWAAPARWRRRSCCASCSTSPRPSTRCTRPPRGIAETGLFDTARYRTPSEARMGVGL